MASGADTVLQRLLGGGVDVCFANPGTSEMHFVAALDNTPQMRAVLCLFEGVVTGAADGYARIAGHPAATLLHVACGFANGVAMLHNAARAGTPVINVVGVNASPTAVISADPTTGKAPLAVDFDGTGSTDSDGTITSMVSRVGVDPISHPDTAIMAMLLAA